MKKSSTGTNAIGEILRGLGHLIEKLGEIEASGEDSGKHGSLRGSDGKVRGIYGVQVKVGLGGSEIKLEPFGNLKPESESGQATVHETREPVCDVFEEETELLIVAEMPGVSAEDVKLEIEGDLLTIQAERRDRKYFKELQLPRPILLSKVQVSAKNGVLELRCPV